MAFEQIANTAQSTTTGSIDGSTNPVTFGVSSVSAFPSSGNFRIIIDSEILLVTSVSGSNFTANRAQEGTTIASHSLGATVTLILTKGSFFQLMGEQNLGGITASSRPSAGQLGRLFFPSDGTGALFRDNGSVWQASANGVGMFTPPIGGFTTWINQNGATLDETAGITTLTANTPPTGGENLACRVTTAPATPWTMTLAFRMCTGIKTNVNAGIIVQDNSTGHLTGFAYQEPGTGSGLTNSAIFNWTSPTSFNNTQAGDVKFWNDLKIMRIVNNGTTIAYQYSSDFRNWIQETTINLSGYFTANITNVGFYINFATGSDVGCVPYMNVFHAVVG